MRASTGVATTEDQVVVATGAGLVRPGREGWLPGRPVDDLAVADGGVWALVERTELHRATADGVEHVATVPDGRATCVHVHGGTVWVGGDEAALWRLRDRTLEPVGSFRDAPTRPEWHTPWGGPPAVFSMASHGDDLYVGVHVGGILRTSDAGATWTETIDLHLDVHEVVVDPRDGTVWAATGRRALAESRDRGATWRFHTSDLHATYSLAAAITSAGVLTGVSSGHAARDGGVYRFDGARFAPVDGLPEPLGGAIGPRQIVGAGDHAALVAPDGRVHVSDDGGRRWRELAGIVDPTGVALAQQP